MSAQVAQKSHHEDAACRLSGLDDPTALSACLRRHPINSINSSGGRCSLALMALVDAPPTAAVSRSRVRGWRTAATLWTGNSSKYSPPHTSTDPPTPQPKQASNPVLSRDTNASRQQANERLELFTPKLVGTSGLIVNVLRKLYLDPVRRKLYSAREVSR